MQVERTKVTPREIKDFIHDHIQSKINHGELAMAGFNMENVEIFEAQLNAFEHGMFEGICNGILWCDGEIEGIDTSEPEVYKEFTIED